MASISEHNSKKPIHNRLILIELNFKNKSKITVKIISEETIKYTLNSLFSCLQQRFLLKSTIINLNFSGSLGSIAYAFEIIKVKI